MHNNSIREISNLDQLQHLTHLYLQWNHIRKIENINHLQNLRKLYLSYNEIQCLDGVDNLNLLEELHLEHQNLEPQHEFTFDVNSLIGISVWILFKSYDLLAYDEFVIYMIIYFHTLYHIHFHIDINSYTKCERFEVN